MTGDTHSTNPSDHGIPEGRESIIGLLVGEGSDDDWLASLPARVGRTGVELALVCLRALAAESLSIAMWAGRVYERQSITVASIPDRLEALRAEASALALEVPGLEYVPGSERHAPATAAWLWRLHNLECETDRIGLVLYDNDAGDDLDELHQGVRATIGHAAIEDAAPQWLLDAMW